MARRLRQRFATQFAVLAASSDGGAPRVSGPRGYDYVCWDIPIGMKLQAIRLIRYVSDDQFAFFALERAPAFDAGTDVTRMVI
jgi:hypothetical protein